mmetsp:Transcript_26617/g.86160  ORF Transcript_26617/g.86160 Transcript_26617/m.86160 type:complete len:99 (+) Transcript_26617:623-919(+)
MPVPNGRTQFPAIEFDDQPGTSTGSHVRELIVLCQRCNLVAKARCGGCRRVHYCGPRCQKKDWPAHRLHCCGVKISASSPPRGESPSSLKVGEEKVVR